MGIQHLADAAFLNELFGKTDAVEEVHDVTGHKDHIIFLAGVDHLIAVCIRKGNGLLAENVLVVAGGFQHRFLVQIVGGCHDNGIHIRTGADAFQTGLIVAAKFGGNGSAVFGIIDGNDLCPLFSFHDASQFSAKVACTYDCITYGFHTVKLLLYLCCFYLTAPSDRPPAILFWIKQKKMMEGTTTIAQAAIRAPQFRISAPSKVLTATEIVVLSELLIKIME